MKNTEANNTEAAAYGCSLNWLLWKVWTFWKHHQEKYRI